MVEQSPQEKIMTDTIQIGDRIKILLDSKFVINSGWFEGTVVKIDPYSNHRSFYWVELDADAQAILGIQQISVFNPKNIKRIG